MIVRCCVVAFYLLMLIKRVSLQDTVVGVIGSSVVLPCYSNQSLLKIQDIEVNWRYNKLNVYDIINGKVSIEQQDIAYKNRAKTFPKDYSNGNFSLELNNLQYNDSGKYLCYIVEESIIRTVKLLIEVPQQAPVRSFIGKSVVLPCSSTKPPLTPEDITVNWRHNDSLNVFDIIKGKVSVEAAYENRTEISKEFLNGNFNLTLNNLHYNDTGNYKCYITNELLIHSVKLEVNQGGQSRTLNILLVPIIYVSILLSI